eukprot:CAMPEP_0202879290 /NCGR_PEP_ID=MMETSP1391-20130828/33410_1 /ASSEMBLY_ACC=CAM_ASM_000867 /TAXON_ID=1034604 /ORGANISM="Chlamydomonas leiostraca, Strain SAG 11-49" /LENGTH=43 /DNA_ID= /DNA_START= /DNA_END= /DNA_ORIENTATION=
MNPTIVASAAENPKPTYARSESQETGSSGRGGGGDLGGGGEGG